VYERKVVICCIELLVELQANGRRQTPTDRFCSLPGWSLFYIVLTTATIRYIIQVSCGGRPEGVTAVKNLSRLSRLGRSKSSRVVSVPSRAGQNLVFLETKIMFLRFVKVFLRFLGFNVGRSETKLRPRSTWRTSHTQGFTFENSRWAKNRSRRDI